MINQEPSTDNIALLCITVQDRLPQKSHSSLRTREQFANVRLGPRLCENSPNFVADGTALHTGYNGVADDILIS